MSAPKQSQRHSQATTPSSNKLPEQLLFNIGAASIVLGGISPRSIRYLIADGRLKSRIVGGRVFIHRSELIRFASEDHVDPIVGTKVVA
jgi:hypothetical protein